MAGEDGRRRLFAAGVPDALRAAADLLAEAATARSGPYSGASPGALAKVVAGVEPFPEEGAGLDAALAGLGRLSLRHGVDPGHPACAAHLHCQPLAAAVAADALAGALGKDVFHAAEFLDHRERLRQAAAITVVGSGQSGAEVFLELLGEQPGCGYRLDWLTRSAGFFPMEYSRLGLEHFTPDYARYFHGLPAATRDRLLPTQDLLYKGIDVDTIAAIGDLLYERTVAGAEPPVRLLAHAEVRSLEPAGGRRRLAGRQCEQGRDFTLEADCVVLATGYRAQPPACLDGLADLVDWDQGGRYRVDLDYRVATDPRVTGGLYVQNGELHTHGVGAPDLGLGAHRAATIVNAVSGREVYRLPMRTAFTDFGVD